jgi:argininosuccinate lyase
VVGSLVRKLVEEDRSFEAMTAEEWRAHSPLFDVDVVEWVTPASSVARKRTPQSTHPDHVERALADVRNWIQRPGD